MYKPTLLSSYLISMTIMFSLSATPTKSETDIFILAGQSNMAGRGGVVRGRWDAVVPPECQPDRRVLRLSATRQWEVAREPLHGDIDAGKVCGVGPGMAFADELLRARGKDEVAGVGLVPCAVGGSRIAQWARGSDLYSSLVDRASTAVRTVGGGGGRLRAVLWFQGESDTVRLGDAMAYKENMERLVMDLRSDLNLPNLLFIQVALASGQGRYIEEVRNGQLGIKLPNVKCVDAKGLGLNPDNLHLATMSQVQLGKMLARAFLAS